MSAILPPGEAKDIDDAQRMYGPEAVREYIEQQRTAQKLRPVDLKSLSTAKIEPPQFSMYPLLPRGQTTLLGGHGDSGKTNLGLVILAHVANGARWAGFEVEQCQAVFVSLEDPGELVRYRLRKIAEVYNLDADAFAENITVWDGSHLDGTLVAESNEGGVKRLVETPLLHEVEQTVAGCGLIVIDNASDAYGADENRRREVRQFIRRLSQIARNNNAALMLLAHLDKLGARHGTNGNSYSGSTAWHNSTRSRLALLKEGESIELRHEKHNFSPEAEPVPLEWQDGVLVPAARDRVMEQVTRERQVAEDADAILEVIKVAIDMGTTLPAALSGASTAAHVLESLPELRDEYRGKGGRTRVRAAITQLLRDKRLQKVEYTDRHRNRRERIELTQSPPESVNG